MYGWYHGLPKESRYISSLQIRKDVGNVVPHRFVMLRMHDGSTHRFDRRPEQKTKDHDPGYNLFGLMLNHAVNCEDSYIANMNRYLLKEIKKVTFCEIELFFDPEQADLVTVISACFGISQNRVAEKYTFLKHNCFFFSWTILMVVSRHFLPYKFPSYTPLKELFDSKVDHLTTFIVKRAIDVFLDLVIETVIIIRNNLGDMSLTKRLLPDRALRLLWRRLAIMRLNLGLRRRLVVQVRRQLDERLAPIHQTIMAMGDIPDWLNKNLWIEEESGTIDPTLRAAINELKWEAVIDAISSGFKDLSSDRVDLGNVQLKKSILGKRFAQFTAVWKAALPDGMNAVKNAASELELEIRDEEAFDKCWTAAQDAAFNTAKTVVEATNVQVGNAQREVVWAKIFDIWPECWKETRGVVEPKSLAALNDIVDEVVRAGRDAVIQGLKKHSDGTLNVCLLKVRQFFGASSSSR